MIKFEIKSICKGGGYMYARTIPPHPKRNSKGLYPLHRVIVENKIGRLMLQDEIAHHVNGDKNDNSESNLQMIDRAEHTLLHNKSKPISLITIKCGYCQRDVTMKLRFFKNRMRRAKFGKLFCSKNCGTANQHKMT